MEAVGSLFLISTHICWWSDQIFSALNFSLCRTFDFKMLGNVFKTEIKAQKSSVDPNIIYKTHHRDLLNEYGYIGL